MAKNEIDFDFDFDKENSFDPRENLDSDQNEDFQFFSDNIDYTAEQNGEANLFGEAGNYDPADMGYSEDYYTNYGEDPNGTFGYDPNGEYSPEGDYDQWNPDAAYDPNAGFGEENAYGQQEAYEGQENYDPQYDENAAYDDQGEYSEAAEEPEAYDEEADYDGAEDDQNEADYDEEDYDEEVPAKKPRKKLTLPKVNLPKVHFKKPKMPNFFRKFITLYFGPLIAAMSGMEPEPEGRRRRSKKRIFKEVYLPPLILLLSLVLVISCVAGSISTTVRGKRVRDEQARKESIANAEAADREQAANNEILAQAERYAQEYDYEHAIEVLDSYSGQPPQEVQTKKSEYVQAQQKLVEWKDPAGIPNLSFQLLIADPERAFANQELGSKYNQNFVTTDEFQKILEALYGGNYVLVDFDSFVEVSQSLDGGQETFSKKPIYLPEGKKPVMLTETMVNYYSYMIDSNDDDIPDAGGSGFASRLVLDGAGDIKAEMVDKDGNTVVGNYDFVPILEDFLKQHPDFSYRGARAILAVTGDEGIFGYRINSSVISDKGQAYYNEQVAGAKELVAALRAKGYTLASFTYGNRNYGQDNATQISEDLQKWNDQITPVIGNVNVMVFAREGDIGDYTGTKYKALKDKGFRIFVGKSDEPFADVTNDYVRQKRLMVTGVNMTFNSNMFTGLFDSGAVKDSRRPEVIKPK